MRKNMYQKFIHWAGMSLALLSLSACSWMGYAAKEGALAATGRSGPESFTLEGELPANFAIEVQAQYGAIAPDKCQTYSIGLGRNITRDHMESFKAETQNKLHNYSFKVPLSYSIGFCEMRLGTVSFLIDGRYGELDWQQHSSNGGLRIVKALPEGAPAFKADGSLDIQGECSWLFQLSKARSRLGQVSKVLSCNAGAYVQRDQLSGKTINLAISLNPEEEPSHDETWIRFPEGWKPCAPKSGWRTCQTPPTFKTFQMNGQTCTVYPNCTE